MTGDQYILAETEQNVAEFSMEGEIGDGWGAGAISLAFAGGYREESIEQTLGPADITAGSLPTADNPTTRPNCVSNTVNLLAPPAGCTGIRGVPAQFAATPNEIFVFTNVQPISGSYNVSEAFVETLLPLVADRTGFEQLDLSLSTRYADYEGSGGIMSWELFFNVQNVFDRDPPAAASFAQFSGTRITNDRLFDFYGRRYVIGIDLAF